MKQTYAYDESALLEEAQTLLANMAAAFCFYQEKALTVSEKLRCLLKSSSVPGVTAPSSGPDKLDGSA